jgi:hypothetical protein
MCCGVYVLNQTFQTTISLVYTFDLEALVSAAGGKQGRDQSHDDDGELTLNIRPPGINSPGPRLGLSVSEF